jgi:cell cycle sensor histidine kinase DivJ
LGLAIVKSIAALHGGTFSLESRPGQGTTAVMHFPQRSAPQA